MSEGRHGQISENNRGEIDADRREVLASIAKYSAAVAGASTVVLSASEAVSRAAVSGCVNQNPGNDKCVGKAPFDGELGEVPSGQIK